MRPFEITPPLLLATFLLWPHPRPILIRWIPTAALALILLHLIIEGFRWQMVPIYALTFSLAISSMITIRSVSDWRPLASYLIFGLLAILTAIPILLPVPAIPSSSGPHAVGTRIYELTDESRREIYSGLEEARRFMIQVWYHLRRIRLPSAPRGWQMRKFTRLPLQNISTCHRFFLTTSRS